MFERVATASGTRLLAALGAVGQHIIGSASLCFIDCR